MKLEGQVESSNQQNIALHQKIMKVKEDLQGKAELKVTLLENLDKIKNSKNDNAS